MSQHRDAIAAYETAIGLKMDHTSAWNNLGLLYEDLSKNQKKKEKNLSAWNVMCLCQYTVHLANCINWIQN